MSNPEIKILRNELARIIAENQKRGLLIEELMRALEEEKRAMAEVIMENDSLKRRLKIYENPHAPPSHGSVLAQQKKARSAKGIKPSGRAAERTDRTPGRRPGHAGISHHRRSREAIHHRPGKCGRCGGTSFSDAGTTAKQIMDIRGMPKAVVVTHVSHECICSDCDAVTATNPPGIKGTSLGPNLLAFLVSVWGKAVSPGNATGLLNDTFGTGLCKTAVKRALAAAAGKMQNAADGIKTSLSKSRCIKMDETPIRFGCAKRYVWACIGDTGVAIAVGTRASAEIDYHFPYYGKPITCDGYAAYNMFHARQRCWAHILREAEFIRYAKANPTAVMLHRKLQELYHEAKLEPPDTGDARLGELTDRVRSIARAYVGLNDNFAVLLKNAAPNLLTFTRYPGMEPTNSESERMLRKVVIHRKIRQKLVTDGGKRMFATIMTCLLTWDKLGLNWFEKLSEVFWAT